MAVNYNEEKNIFCLDTKKSTYLIGCSPEGYLGHIYYGDRLNQEADNYLLRMGIEMLVMDDGWFGNRNSDDCSLGDWTVNEKKITGGLKHLVDEVNKIGLEFGIWFEPEMISPDSEFYYKHPDWAIQIPGREAAQSRHLYWFRMKLAKSPMDAGTGRD